jgi:urocanate hydratase
MAERNVDNAGAPAQHQPVRAPRGLTPSCKGWAQEAALRALMNSLDPDVAENARELVLYGGNYRAARDWDCFAAIVASLRELENDQTLLVHSGKPVGVFRSPASAPRVIIANAFPDLGPDLDLDPNSSSPGRSRPIGTIGAKHSPAGSWLYAGTQSALQDAFELFATLASKYFDRSLAGKLVVAGGMGALGGAQPLAALMNGAAFLGIDADPERIKRRVKSGYCDVMVNDLDESLRILKNTVRKREPASVGLIGNCAAVMPELARRGVVPDLLSSRILHHEPGDPADPMGYIPQNLTAQQAADLRHRDAHAYREQALDSIAAQVRAMLALQRLGAVAFDRGTGILALAYERGVRDALEIPDLASGTAGLAGGPTRDSRTSDDRNSVTCLALSGEPAEIARTDRLLLDLFPEDNDLLRWIALAGKHVRFQGLPARAFRLEFSQLVKFAAAVNELVAQRELTAPIVIGEVSLTGSDAGAGSVIDDGGWSVVTEMLITPGSAAWITIDSPRGAGGGAQRSVRRVIVADGTPETSDRLNRATIGTRAAANLQAAPHPHKSDVEAAELARKQLIRIPMP